MWNAWYSEDDSGLEPKGEFANRRLDTTAKLLGEEEARSYRSGAGLVQKSRWKLIVCFSNPLECFPNFLPKFSICERFF